MILPTFTTSPAAEKFIRRMVRFSEHPAGGFRLTVSPGGCSGYSAEFTVEAAPRAGDAEVAVGGTRVFLPAESRLVLDGLSVDFEDTPTRSGLTFFNPNAAPCACSSSGDAAATKPAQATVSVASIKRAGHPA
jgi:iron-sulfur cluster assembly accessory protein